ncbi:hypothetical protein ACS5PK_18045 [Roseateles sp. DB2]|uniref:hypothetical protein n=1 Tax=Roseateles sp. DB2 TaxID=3453717 RepID=UPI003EEAED78
MPSLPPLPPQLPAALLLLCALAPGPALGAPEPWAGTAYIRQEVRRHFEGQAHGLGRQTMGALFDQCNAFRAAAGLAPNSPPADLLDGVDTEIVERYYDTGKALTWVSRYGLTPTDLQRWLDEGARTPGVPPARPPDCSLYKKTDLSVGELWVDGVRYELRHDKKAIGSRRHPSLVARDMGLPLTEDPPSLILGQRCRRLDSRSSPLISGESCLWLLFPAQQYLNWPWMLESRAILGRGPHAMVEEVRTLALSVGRASPKDIFRIPEGYTVRMLP